MPGSQRSMRALALALLLALPAAGHAETVYVIDRLVVGLRAEPAEGASAVKSVDSGTVLEVLERQDSLVHVRDPQGVEGWIDGRYLSGQPPARVQMQALQAELVRVRAQLAKAPAVQGEASAAAIQKLEAELSNARTQLAQAQAQVKDARREPVPPPAERQPSSGGFSFGWLAFGFAMLGVGFVVGIVWVRESIRRRMGGMYLRI